MPSLGIALLGTFEIVSNGRPLPGLGSGKLAALFAYLTCEPGPHRREMLADLFWPGLTEEAARLNLRQSLFRLRSLLTEGGTADPIIASRTHLAYDTRLPLQRDLDAFAAAPATCVRPATGVCPACQDCLAQMEASVTLYRGPFLASIALSDCPDFEDWLQFKRESLHRRALDLLLRLVDCHERAGNPQRAEPFALRHVELEPWSETGYLRAMQLLARTGRREAALALYAACRRVMERELGVLPGTELRALAEQIRQGTTAQDGDPCGQEMPPREERRQVAVLYCELTAHGVADPEDALPRLNAPQARCEAIMRDRDGHVVRTHGGGLLTYFGYPLATENAVLAAVRAAREIIRTLPVDVSARLAVHVGPIVVFGSASVPDPVGATTGGAIQLHRAAVAGEVLVSDAARRHVAGYFRFERLASRQARALPRGQTAYRVAAETGATHRLAANANLTPLVGREGELAQLDAAWARARRGKFGVVLLVGEAGIGKSRLAHTLAQRAAADNGQLRELRCFPETRQSPLRPVITLFEALCGHAAGDTLPSRLDKLRELLAQRTPRLAERGLPLLARLFDLPTELTPSPALVPEALKAATHELLVDLFLAVTTDQPMLLLVEDLHWADGATLELLALLRSRAASARALLLLTTRPDGAGSSTGPTGAANWPGATRLDLAPLPDAVIAAMLDSIGTNLDARLRAAIVTRADGIPLFAEELAAAGGADGLPDKLHDLLRTRLDRLAQGRGVAQLAACIGRELELTFLASIGDSSGMASRTLEQGLAELCASGLVQPLADGRFQFKHALVREAAYATQTRAVRRAAHRAIAERLEQDRATHTPETLARHWQETDEATRAIPYWQAAGQRAAAGYDHHEAIAHLSAGLHLLEQLPPDAERDRREFSLRLDLARSEQEVAGYGGKNAFAHLARAIALHSAGAGASPELFAALWGLWEGAASMADYRESERLARQLCDIAATESEPDLLRQAHYALGNSLFWAGAFATSQAHLEAALALEALTGDATAEPARDCYGRILPIAVRAYLSAVMWFRGETTALGMSEQSLALARDFGDPSGLAFALTFAASLRRWMGDADAALHLAAQGREAAAACQSAVFCTNFDVMLDSQAVARGDQTALARVDGHINTLRAAMSGIAVAALAPYAEALIDAGEFACARTVLAEAMLMATNKHDRHYLAELYRLDGLCLERLGEMGAARDRYAAALALAEEQGARVFATRAQRHLSTS